MAKFRPTPLPARVHGAAVAMREESKSAIRASYEAGISDIQRAMLRGKATAYTEASILLDALETGRRSVKLRKFRKASS